MIEKTGNFILDYVLAFTSASISCLATAPVNRALAIVQTQGTIKNLQTPYTGVLDCIARVYREEGLKHLWRGTSAAIAGKASGLIFQFNLNDFFKTILCPFNPKTDYTKVVIGNILSGMTAGAVSRIFTHPFGVVRIQLAADLGKGPQDRKFIGLRDCWKNIYRTSGAQGLYKGFLLSILQNSVYRGLYFGIYDTLKHVLFDQKTSTMFKFLVAQTTTTLSLFAVYPIEVVKHRLMIQGGRVEPDYSNAIDCVKKMVKNEGVRSLYKGFAFTTGLNVSSSIALVLYDHWKATNKTSI